jgi:16S rRNA (guanine527-N7)-methyltransferase
MTPRAASERELRAGLLRAGLETLALQATDAAIARLLDFLDLLAKWNRHYNLTSVRDPQQMLHQHLLDCLAVLPALDRHLQGREARLLDVGSGAGLPGVVLAAMRPQWKICCVDAVAKKATFVRQVAAELGLKNLLAMHARAECLQLEPFDLVISRAFASLSDFTRLTRRHVAPGGCWLSMKGRNPVEELAELPEAIEVFHVEQLCVPGLQAQRCLIWMRPALMGKPSG